MKSVPITIFFCAMIREWEAMALYLNTLLLTSLEVLFSSCADNVKFKAAK